MTLLRVRHLTAYDYADPVEMGAHVVHLRPRSLPYQQVRHFALHTGPAPARVGWGADHFGNAVGWVFLAGVHAALWLEAVAEVEVTPRPVPDPMTTLPWEHVAELAQQPAAAAEAAEFTFASGRVPLLADARAWVAPSFSAGRPVLACVLDLVHRFATEFRFDPAATTVSTPVARVLELRAGVCQDFAHLMIAGLRVLGLPARYVSGYLRTRPPPGKPRLVGADQSHAWVGVWLGPEHGWIDVDPTNALVVQDSHVVLGWGRDYADVSPVRGVLLGGGEHTLKVSVDLAPVEEALASDQPGTLDAAEHA